MRVVANLCCATERRDGERRTMCTRGHVAEDQLRYFDTIIPRTTVSIVHTSLSGHTLALHLTDTHHAAGSTPGAKQTRLVHAPMLVPRNIVVPVARLATSCSMEEPASLV